MKNIIVIFSVIILYSYSLICQQTPDVDLPLTVSDNLGNSKELRYGVDPLATDGIDTCLGEILLPPPPPAGAFDARLNLSGVLNSDATWKDYRLGVIPYSGVKTHYIQHQVGSGGTSIIFEWNMPNEVTGLLQDMFGGVIVNVTMSEVGSYILTNLAVNPLKMIITYDEALLVELSYFTAMLYGEIVKLEWATATEVSNYGFEIEKSIEASDWDSIGFVEGSGNSNSPKRYYFEDHDLIGGSIFQYRLKQIDTYGAYEYSKIVGVQIIPADYQLIQNYPNPFNPTTTIEFSLPVASDVELRVYNILGQQVAALINDQRSAGTHSVLWNANDSNGMKLSSGIYFYMLKASGVDGNEFQEIKKMVLLK